MRFQKIIFYLLSFSILIFAYSCKSNKTAFFHYHYPSYSIKKASVEQGQNLDGITANFEEKLDPNIVFQEKPSFINTSKNINAPVSIKSKRIDKTTTTTIETRGKKNLKSELRKIKKNNIHTGKGSVPLWVLVLLAIFIPPLAVFFVDGISTPFWIDLVLTIIFWIPGAIYALLRIFK